MFTWEKLNISVRLPMSLRTGDRLREWAVRVYKFLSAKYALKDVAARKIKLSKFEDMNDPFELMGSSWSEADVDDIINSYSAKRVGALCFSANWANPLLWSHYADKHKGICLGFDIPDGNDICHRPIYIDRPEKQCPQVLYNAVLTGNAAIAEEPVMRKLKMKFKGWEYEDEVRVFATLDGKDGKLSYFDFGDNLVLQQVIVGVRCPVSRKKLEESLRGYRPSVEVIRAQLSSESFEVFADPAGFTERQTP